MTEKEDPLHRLSRTPTKASRQQQWEVWKEAERERTRPIKEWGVSPSKKKTAPPKTPPHRSGVKSTPKKTISTPKKTPNKKPSPQKAALKSPLSTPKQTTKSESAEEKVKKTRSSVKSSPAVTKKVPEKTATPSPHPIPTALMQIEIPNKEAGMKLFDQLDENASGKLSLAELDKGVVTLFPEWNNKPAIMAAYKAADVSGNGFVERKEFGYFLRYLVYYNNLWSLFASIDSDADRRITRDEFVAAADKLDLPSDANAVFDEIDENAGGMILFDELVHWMATNKSTWDMDEIEEVQKKLEETNVADTNELAAPEEMAPPPPPPEPVPAAVMQIKIPDKEVGMKLFDQLDENASGRLSLAELDKGVVTLFPEWNNKPAIMAAYKAADRSGNGFVERKEFGYFLRYIVYYNNLWSLFASMDEDGDRRISQDEFLAAASKMDLPSDADVVFTEIDENGGGMILFDELVHWMATMGSD